MELSQQAVLAATAGALAWCLLSSPEPASPPPTGVAVRVGAATRYILSTSGRPSSLERYRGLLQNSLGLDIAYTPISAQDGGAIDPQQFCWALRGVNAIGGAISRDIKASVVPYLDEVEPFARRVGSVNTVLRRGDRLVGFNTDAAGFRSAITTGVAASGVTVRSAVVYGYGGVTNVVVHVLQELGYRVALTGRRPEEAKRRAAELGASAFVPGETDDAGPFELLVNAAPVTDQPLGQAKGLLAALGQGVRVAFDHEMPGAALRSHCQEHGIAHIPGTAMCERRLAPPPPLHLLPKD